MAAEVLKIVVKVGNKSNIAFKGKLSRAYRAITVKELELIVSIQKDIHVVVIENIKQSENASIKEFIHKFKSLDVKNKVYFYVKDNDDFTCGIADELAYDIYLNLRDLHKAIENKFGVSVGTELSMRTTPTEEELVGSDIGYDETFDSSFEEALDTLKKTQSSVLAQEIVYELPNIESKDDLDILDISIIEDDIAKTSNSIDCELAENNEGNEEIESNQSLDRVIVQLNNLKAEKIYTLGQLESALSRIRKLTEVVDALEDEKNSYKNMMKSMQESDDILEDPIGLAEYESLGKELDTLKADYNALKAQVTNEEINKEKLSEANGLVIELATLKADYNALKAQVTNEEINKEKLSEANGLVIELDTKLKELQIKLSEIKYRLTVESMGRLKVTRMITRAVSEVNITNMNLSEKIDEVYNTSEEIRKLAQAKEDYEQLINKLNTEITNLSAQMTSGDEINKLRVEKIELQGKLDLMASQLSSKEYQYTLLVQTYGVDENSANTIIENNKTLEGVNKSLRDQIIMLKNEYEQSKRDKVYTMQNAKSLENSNRQLKTSLNVITSGISSGVGLRVPPCRYTGKGMIIPVFGCGSFGITTTAMSIALKLAVDTRVLFIDFDMVMPKADGWFKSNPIVKNIPEFDSTDSKSTGLGLLIDRQVQFFLNYAPSMINKPIQTKNGSVDYISGLYCRPDTIKLISADYTSFFNYCGNNYTYVIIDFGRLGSSQLNDIIIKMVADIAYKNVVVTTNDKFEIRNFNMKLEESNIDKNNVAWLVNMCESTNMDPASKKYISPAGYSMMPFHSNIYGKKIDFTKEKFTRDKLELLISTIFGK